MKGLHINFAYLVLSEIENERSIAADDVMIIEKKKKRAYSLGIIIVAITVGSQQAVTLFPGFDASVAGFDNSTLLH